MKLQKYLQRGNQKVKNINLPHYLDKKEKLNLPSNEVLKCKK